MLVEENELDYLNKSEVGLNSIDEEDNNNSNDNNNSMEENFSNEIEKILIETYNRNISIITQGNINEYNKSFKEIQETEKQKEIKEKNQAKEIKIIIILTNEATQKDDDYLNNHLEKEENKSKGENKNNNYIKEELNEERKEELNEERKEELNEEIKEELNENSMIHNLNSTQFKSKIYN